MDFIVRGNYLDPDGQPVIATQAPHPNDPNVVSGYASALAWCCRWIKACADITLFAGPGYALTWDHGRTRHLLRPGEFVVWAGEGFRVVEPDRFAATYAAVDLDQSTEEPS